MKFEIEIPVYKTLLNKVRKSLLSTGDNEPMHYIVHEVSKDGIKLISSNFRSRTEFFLPVGEYVTIIEEGVSCVFGTKLIELVGMFAEGKLTIATKVDGSQEKAKITMISDARKSAYQIPCCNLSLYPMGDFVLSGEYRAITINPQTLKYMIKNTEFATSKDESADISLMNISLEFSEERMSAAGVSFEMISYVDAPKENVSGSGVFYIMSIATKDFLTLLDDVNDVQILSDGKIMVVKQTSMVYSFRMVNVNFPDWKSKVGIEYERYFNIGREKFIDALKQMKIIAPACKIKVEGTEVFMSSFQLDDSLIGVDSYAEEKLNCDGNSSGEFIVIIDMLLDVFNRSVAPIVKVCYGAEASMPIKVIIDEKSNTLISTLRE